MVNNFVIPVIEKHRDEGRAEGRVEGRVEERAAWREWNRRRIDAEAQGLPFNEPPPGGQPNNGQNGRQTDDN